MTRLDIRAWVARFAQLIFGLPHVPALVPVRQPARALRRRD